MALKRNERYPGRFSNPTTDHPQGAFKNRTAPSAQDGSYLEQDWSNDWDGFFGRLLTVAGITPNGNVDTALASQYYDALSQLFVAAGSLGNSATRNVGTTSGTVAAGDDSRIVNAITAASPAACTAWVNFSGVSTTTIFDSYNVSSVAYAGAGTYNVNFANPLANSNYAVGISGSQPDFAGQGFCVGIRADTSGANLQKSTTMVGLLNQTSGGSNQDLTNCSVIIFGGK